LAPKTNLERRLQRRILVEMNTTEYQFSVSSGVSRSNSPPVRGDLLEQRNWPEHPACVLLAAHRSELRENRAKLLREVRKVSHPLACVVVKVLRNRDALNPPAIGEAWPWLVGDLACLPTEKVRDVAKAWLAVYIYTLLLDKACDEPGVPPEPAETLVGALLFEVGLGDFFAMTSGTAWQNVVREAVRSSIRDQELDVRLAGQLDNLDSKRRSAAGKNAGFVICTAALTAASHLDKSVLDQFARSVLLAFQHLDDIADFEDDWRAKNFTPLLVGASDRLTAIEGREGGRSEILEALLRSGALRDVLVEAQSAIAQGLRKVADVYGEARHSGASKFFRSLQSAMAAAIETIDRAIPLLNAPTHRNCKLAVLEEVEGRLRIVAQQS
jgi:hypothetical protein